MIWRAPEAEVFPLCADNGISQIVWSPLAQGVLTGKYAPGERAAVGLARGERGDGLRDRALHATTAVLEAVQRLRPIAEEAGPDDGRSSALAWVLRRDEVASAIVGASRPEQVHANAAASGVELSPDTLTAIDEALGRRRGHRAWHDVGERTPSEGDQRTARRLDASTQSPAGRASAARRALVDDARRRGATPS